MKAKWKTIAFWTIGILITAGQFIRLFIDSSFYDSASAHFQSLPIWLRIALLVFSVVLIIWLFPYKPSKK